MTKQVQRRRGTATQHTSFTGAEGELSVNTTNKSVHVHDNVTAGGFEAARADMDNVTSSSILTAAGITATTTELNYVDGVTSAIQTQLDGKAGTASPTFTGTLTTANLTATGTTTLAGASTSADITFGDNDKAVFGAGSDLQIYHDGSNSFIVDQGTGGLVLRGSTYVALQGTNGENAVIASENGAVDLRYDNASKLTTTSTGIDVTGTVTADGLTVDHNTGGPYNVDKSLSSYSSTNGVYLNGNASGWLRLNNDGAGSTRIDLYGSSYAEANVIKMYSASNERLSIDANGDISFYEDTGTTAKFFWDASAERLGIGTSSPSAELHIEKSSADAAVRLVRTGYGYTELIGSTGGSGNDFKINLNGTDRFYIQNSSGNVGIGESDPDSTLTVKGASHTNFQVKSNSESTKAFIQTVQDSDVRIGSSTNHPVAFYQNGTERMRIDSSGNVGIGNSSPTTDSLAGIGGLVIGNGTDARGITLYGTTTTQQNIAFTDTSSSQQGLIQYDHAGDYMRLFTNAAERMRLDASGNLLVGATSAVGLGNGTNEGISISSSQKQIIVGTDSDVSLYLNRQTLDGDIVQFRKDGSTVGSIGSNGGSRLYIESGDVGLRLLPDQDDIRPCSSAGANRDDAIDLGDSAARFKDLYLSGGVFLGGTGSSNKLEDYEEGTFSIEVREGSGGTDAVSTNVSNFARYQKVGNIVFVYWRVNVSSSSGSTLHIAGLPFTSGQNNFQAGGGMVHGQKAHTFFALSGSEFRGYRTVDGSGAVTSDANGVYRGSFHYQAN